MKSELQDKLFGVLNVKNSYIFITTNKVITAMAKAYNVDSEEMIKIIKDLSLSNNLIASKDSYSDGYLLTKSGEQFLFNPETFEIDELIVSKIFEENSNTYVYVIGFPLTDKQNNEIKGKIINLSTETLGKLNRDVLEKLLTIAYPRDVAKLCQTNTKFRHVCNDPNVFRRLINKHYPYAEYTDDPRNQFYALIDGLHYKKFNPIIRKSNELIPYELPRFRVDLTAVKSKRKIEGTVETDFFTKMIHGNVVTTGWASTTPEQARDVGLTFIAMSEILQNILNTYPDLPDNLKNYLRQ